MIIYLIILGILIGISIFSEIMRKKYNDKRFWYSTIYAGFAMLLITFLIYNKLT